MTERLTFFELNVYLPHVKLRGLGSRTSGETDLSPAAAHNLLFIWTLWTFHKSMCASAAAERTHARVYMYTYIYIHIYIYICIYIYLSTAPHASQWSSCLRRKTVEEWVDVIKDRLCFTNILLISGQNRNSSVPHSNTSNKLNESL